jgi:chemotaxis protein methyltransferase CheR
MKEAEFAYLRAFLHERTGVSLGPNKGYLAEARLRAVRHRFAIGSDRDLVTRLKLGRELDLARAVLEAMTTNETFFFRDKVPFELLRSVLLPRAVAAKGGRGRIRIWCAAASSGQEPYSVAMLVDAIRPELGGCGVEILATDISTEMLARAENGRYTQYEVQRGLPIELLLRHFTKVDRDWQISEPIRRMVQFRPLNLTKAFDHLGPFDIVICRNVLIYFDAATRTDVMERLADALNPEGAVLFGSAETPTGLTAALVPDQDHSAVYVRGRSPSDRPALAGTGRLARTSSTARNLRLV